MREIGSEFWDVPAADQRNTVFPDNIQWFLSGRSALQAIINDIKDCYSVAMPSWCCDSMIKPFVDAGMEVRFYPVYWKDGLIQEISLGSDILFLMDYFGYSATVADLTGYGGVIIRDLTHSLFTSGCSRKGDMNQADYYFGSLRKWCGVWTGGYAWTGDGHRFADIDACCDQYVELRKKAMDQKAKFINGEHGNKEYLKYFHEAEELLDKTGIAAADSRDIYLAKRLATELIAARRRANAEILCAAFPDWIMFSDPKDSDCPMFVPVLVPDGKRDALRNYLIKNEIYCPIHWPVSKYHSLDDRTEYIYKNELSLVCDQRYSVEDMIRVVETINTFWKEV